MSDNSILSENETPVKVKKDAMGYDAISTYLPLDGIGINALPDSEKYKRGIKENTTGKTRTLGIWMSCPDCGISRNSRILFQMIMGLNYVRK